MKPNKEGYFQRSLRYTGPCDVCSKRAKMIEFFRPLSEEKSGVCGGTVQDVSISHEAVCSFDCFKTTADYLGPNPPISS